MTKEERKEYNKQRYLQKKEQILEQVKQYQQTPIGRAVHLVNRYKQNDKKYGRGECTLTAKWVVENIFTKKCAHCDESDWRKLGCNRLDNSKPHTPDNVEPCCKECNDELAGVEIAKEKSKQVYQYTLSGELVKVWDSTQECGRNGYHQGTVSDCCNGRFKTHKGYRWSYEPI